MRLNSSGGVTLPNLGRGLIYAGGACCTNASKVSIKEIFALIVTDSQTLPKDFADGVGIFQDRQL